MKRLFLLLGILFCLALPSLGQSNIVTTLPTTCTPASPGVTGSEPVTLSAGGKAIPMYCSQSNIYSPMVKNGTIFADSYTGAFDVKIRACIADAIAQGGGICDATALYGAQTQTAEIDIGDGTVAVTLLLAPNLVDVVTMNTAGACAFKVMNDSRLIGMTEGGTHTATIQSAASTNTGSLVCSNFVPGTGQYATVKGLLVYNPSGGTFTNGAVFTKNTFDGSTFSNLWIANYGGIGLHVQATCCATKFESIVIDGGHVAGSIPLQVDSLQGDLQPVTATYFYNMSVDHPGTGLNAIKMTRTFNSTLVTDNVAFFGLYMEGNNTDTTTPLILIDSLTRTSWNDVTANLRSASSTQYVWNIVNTSFSSNTPDTSIFGFNYLNCTCTLPNDVVHDLNGVVAKTLADGTMAGYINGTLVGPMTITGLSNSAFAPSLTVSGTNNPNFAVSGDALSDQDMRIIDTHAGGHAWEFGEILNVATFYMRDDSQTGLPSFGFKHLGTTAASAGVFTTTLTGVRTWTVPDASFTFAGKDLAQTWTADQTFNTTNTGVKLPVLAAAAPTVDGNIAVDSGDHMTYVGSNATTQRISKTCGLIADHGGSSSATLGTITWSASCTFPVKASTVYQYDCDVLSTSTNAAGGLFMGITGPSTPVASNYALSQYLTATTSQTHNISQTTTYSTTGAGVVGQTITTTWAAHFAGTFENGTNAGTLSFQFANGSATGSTVVKRGSFCTVH